MTTAQPAPRAAWPEGCSWPGPARRPRRDHVDGALTGSRAPVTRHLPSGPAEPVTSRAVSPGPECVAEGHGGERGQAGARPRTSGPDSVDRSCCPHRPVAQERPHAGGLPRRDWRTTGGLLEKPSPWQRTSSPVGARVARVRTASRRTASQAGAARVLLTVRGRGGQPGIAWRRTAGGHGRPACWDGVESSHGTRGRVHRLSRRRPRRR